MALFPVSPTNGQQTTVNNITYTYDSAQSAWVRTSTSGDINAGNGTFSGNLVVGSNVAAGNLVGIYANGNSNINIPTANGNINFSSAGNANIVTVTGNGVNVAGRLYQSGGDVTLDGIVLANTIYTYYTTIYGPGGSLSLSDTSNGSTSQYNVSITSGNVFTIDQNGTNTTWRFYGSNGAFTAPGDISANYYIGNGNLLTGMFASSVTKTANYAAVAGDILACNTITTGSFTITLPASPVAGQRGITIYDAGTTETSNGFAANNLTVARNGSTIHNIADDVLFSTKGVCVTFEYVDGTWRMRVG